MRLATLCVALSFSTMIISRYFERPDLPNQQKEELPDHQGALGHGTSSSSGKNIALLRPDEEAGLDHHGCYFEQKEALTTRLQAGTST